MAKMKSLYTCNNCAAQFPKWEGQCRECGSWNTLVEEQQVKSAPAGKRGWTKGENPVLKLSDSVEAQSLARHSTNIGELDRVMGGGVVPGSYILLGGDPGIGKSTLLLQMAGGLADSKLKVLYVSGEESVDQTALRAQRLGIRQENVTVASESLLENIEKLARTHKPDILIVDSIQTIYLSEITSAPGSVSQVRECASRLMDLAKGQGIATFLIGHVTKDGHIAGPKTLEHMVDTVLAFEGDGNHVFRLLRAIKNRFGPTNELGVFQMDAKGLEEVANPSEMFLEERGHNLVGSAIFSAMEGTRPLLCEIQALTASSPLANPRRTSIGFDFNRVHLLVAVLDKHLDLDLSKSDVFVNIVGGLKITEPAADLAVAAALISSSNFQEIPAKVAFFGEIGLTGEVRGSNFAEDRVREAAKLGFENFVLPASNKRHLKDLSAETKNRLHFVKSVYDLPNIIEKLQPPVSAGSPHPNH